jgi:hypothetical protein
MISPTMAGTICQDWPNLSLSQPHRPFSPQLHRTVDVGSVLDGFAPNECLKYSATPDMALPNWDTL